ncbi:MAG: sensor histidine kinase [Nostocoides sp.]
MTRRIGLIVAATTSAVVIAFIVPLCLLVASVAHDRGAARARDQAQSVATLVATVTDTQTLQRTVADLSVRGPQVVVVEQDGTVYGQPASLPADTATSVAQARRDRAAITLDQDHGLDALTPVTTPDGLAVVVATVGTDELRSGVSTAWATIITLGLGLIALSVLIAGRLGRWISVPVTDLAEVAHRLREGDSAARAVPDGPPETVELGDALNALADRIHDLVAAEREHVADLGHRLRTPVTALRLDTDLVEDPELADRLRGHVDHLQRSIDSVVREARRSVTDELPASSTLGAVTRERLDFWRPLAEDQGREVTLVGAEIPVKVTLPADDLRELLDTVLDNVFAHTPDGAAIRVAVRQIGGWGELSVADQGTGMDLPWRGRGHSAGGSTGLGLAIVHRLAEGVGGSVTLARASIGGLEVTIRLPSAATPAE